MISQAKLKTTIGSLLILFSLTGGTCVLAQGDVGIPTPTTPTPTNNTTTPSKDTSGSYKNLEKIPGQKESTNSFVAYIEDLYSFGIGISALLAVFMIAVGAFEYIVFSAGNAGKAGAGKDKIYSAIYGLILVLLVWLIFFVINPDLLHGVLTGTKYQTGYGSRPTSGGGGGGGTTDGYKSACPDPSSTKGIDYSKAEGDSKVSYNSNCSKYDSYFQRYGSLITNMDSSINGECVLRAIAMKESTCGTNKGPSGANACGLMQLQEGTASGIAGRKVECQELINNDELSVELAAKYVSNNYNAATKANDNLAGMFAGYNSGYGCSGNGKAKSLCPSSDCQGVTAFECCVNPGGLDESINYAWNTRALYSQCAGH